MRNPHRMVLRYCARTTWPTRMVDRSVRSYSVVGQVAAVTHHDLVKCVPAMEDVFPMVAMSVEVPVTHSVGANHPDICIAADEHHISVDNGRDVDVIRRRLISLFDDHGRRWGRRRSHCGRQYFVHLVRIDHELALLVGRTPRKERRASDRCERNSQCCFQIYPRLRRFKCVLI
ncbi:MAG: hypothetical protein QOI13_2429 [Paraburkholderia sp.]|nr:hypothetical protein [Paraburkholderia sp.]